MSLTRILKHKVYKNLRSWFKYHFPNPGLEKKINLVVPPSIPLNPNPGEIGTALDYLIRFHLERKNKKVIHRSNYWVAEMGLNNIMNICETSLHSHMCIGNSNTVTKLVEIEPFKDYLIKEFESAKKNHSEFIKTGELTPDLIKSSIFLSKLDSKYRANIIDVNIDNIDSNSVDELKKLINIVPWSEFKAKKHCYLNPSFGEGSKLTEGADADLIIDDVLIDIKTSKEFKLNGNDLNQIIGYYLLSKIGKINNEFDSNIKEIAIYFARYGYFWKIPLSHFYELEKYDELKDEFEKLVTNPRLDFVKDKPKRNKLFLNLPKDSPFG